MSNPILPEIEAADPHLCLFGDRYWLYATAAGATEPGFTAWSSPDLQAWRFEGMILRFAEVGWAVSDAWAPACMERNGQYYFYFCADSRIGVAVADHPAGPFRDALGKPLVPYKDDISVIDPMPYLDDDGQAYLYWGAVPASWLDGKATVINTHLSVHRLQSDMLTLDGPEQETIHTLPEPGRPFGIHIEAQCVFKRKDLYYLMWSAGNWNASAPRDAYRVEYATGLSPLGPWIRAENRALESNPAANLIGPGHHSVLHLPGTENWLCCYHSHAGDAVRHLCLDWLRFTEDDRIETVLPGVEGVGAVPVRCWIERHDHPAGKPVSVGSIIPLSAHLPDGQQPRRVEYYAGPVLLASVEQALYRFTWNPVAPGYYPVSVRVTTDSGAVLTSAPLHVDIVAAR